MLSIIIPSYKDPLLVKTIDSLLENAEGSIEILAVLDGYWPAFELRGDPRVRYIHLGKNSGMRNAINIGVSASSGEYIMRTDEHCIFGDGFDVILTKDCEPNWIVTPRRYYLDPVEWKVMDIPYVDYEKLAINGDHKFEGQKWHSRTKEREQIMIDETMSMQGSCWVMKKSWWEAVIGELQTEGYGPLVQDSHEMVFKTWKAGGKLMLNKNTWFAHKHKSFRRTHDEETIPALKEQSYRYALDTWKEYYLNEIKPKWNL